MERPTLPDWEGEMIEEAIDEAERRLEAEKKDARKRALQLAREQAYHRLAVEIDRPAAGKVSSNQLSFFRNDPTLFDDAG
ncbi:MAG: hypothetical protein M3P18_04180 [Actinomycetota bacterium]|nr:hypothetical protein [Actinomycetota bacterium]